MTHPVIFPLDEVLSTFRSHDRVILLGTGGVAQARAMAGLAADDPAPQSLADMLKTEATQAPASTSVAAVPPAISAQEMQSLNDILLLNTYVSVASMRYLYQINPKGWDITDKAQAADFTRQAANAKFRILTDGMGGFLSLNTSSARSMSKSVTSADLHFEFLSELFAGFDFPPAAMAELDSILTSVTKTLGELKMSWSDQSQTLDHMIFVFYFEEVAGLNYKLPRMRLFYLHIDQSSWEAAVGKSSVKHFQFNMNYADNVYMMDPNSVESQRDAIQKLITKLTNQSLEAIDALTSPKVVKTK